MSKRLTLSLLLLATALLVPSTGFAGRSGGVEKACYYDCQSCGYRKVRLCTLCNGVASCGSCVSGTACAV